jgi:O-antigen/teichoic acid export membrane protein
MKTAFFFDLCVAIIQVSGLFLFAYLGYLSSVFAHCIVGLACGIVALNWVIARRKIFKLQSRQIVLDFKLNWSLGKWIFASGLLWAFSMNFYPWILTSMHDTAAAGVWAACMGIAALGNIILMGGQNYLGPKIASVYAQKGIHALCDFVIKSCSLFSGFILFLCLPILLFGGDFLVLIYGKAYAGNGLTISILMINLALGAVAFCFSRGLFSIQRADIDFIINFVPLLILFTFGIWSVKSYGPAGAACGLLLANLASAIARGVAFIVLIRNGVIINDPAR